MENPLPTPESIKQTAKDVIKTIGRVITLRAFLPEHPYLPEHRIDEDMTNG